jgi:hypothetical protein
LDDNKNTEFFLFVKKFSDDMSININDVLMNDGLIKILEKMFTEKGNKKE